jgi:hypothetical protein
VLFVFVLRVVRREHEIAVTPARERERTHGRRNTN